ncbi:Ribonuclease H-like superfamily protein [Senna tora]|uniref:Ribonuclease H-like superfamily protein n=1 Tax=Senna tora TaxID=362788 RepID=A0A834TR48_9FABA|nr:Ribonuclease H-like superfamily protein [Senna tora]
MPQYKSVWSLKLPYKVIMFMWRVLSDNLPAFSVLNHHHMNLDNICMAYGGVAIKMINTMWSTYNTAFSNQVYKNKSMVTPLCWNHKKWSFVDALPTDLLSVIFFVKKIKVHTSARRIRKISIIHVVYNLREQENLRQAFLMVLRRGLQIIWNHHQSINVCNVVVFQKYMASLITSTFRNNANLRLLV